MEPRVKLYYAERRIIDVTRTTHTSLDVLWEKQIDDDRNVDGERELSDAWTGFTRFILLNERPTEGYSWSGWRLTRKQTTSRPDKLWTDLIGCIKTKRKAKVCHRETKARSCQTITWHLLHWILMVKKFKARHHDKCSKKVGNSGASSIALLNSTSSVQGNLSHSWTTQNEIFLYC